MKPLIPHNSSHTSRISAVTSVLTNIAAQSAIQTLRSIHGTIEGAQRQVSSGLKVGTASDNAAYWSIATTMRSDNMAISAVQDALGLGAAKVDTAYAGMEAVVDVLSEFRSKLVAAEEDGVDRGKIQTELEQLKDQLASIASSASFNGVNWLKTQAPENLWELSSLPTSVVSSFIRSDSGSVHVDRMEIDLVDLSLFNVGGGGALQKDIRSLGDIGGFRDAWYGGIGAAGFQQWQFTGPFAFGPSDTISFDLTLDASPLSAGVTYSVQIDRSVVDAALGTSDGAITDAWDFSAVINRALSSAGVPAGSTVYGNDDEVTIGSTEGTGHPGSSVSITLPISTLPAGAAGGLETTPLYTIANQYPSWTIPFTAPFTLYREVEFYFLLQAGSGPLTRITVDRETVDAALGTSDGLVATAADFAAILDTALSGIGASVSSIGSSIKVDVDTSVYPEAGRRTMLQFHTVTDNLGPAPDFDIVDVDITDPANDLDHYLSGVDYMLQKVISAASALGAIKSRIDMQHEFTQRLTDSIDSGIGRLVDADMNEASTRLKALQTQEQLAIQSLSIANTNAEGILTLFQ